MTPTPETISKKHRKMYMRMARAASLAGTCDRARVGAVIVKNGGIIGTGYNGSARGDKHCDDVGHLMHAGHCIRTVHAEENAILNAAKNGGGTWGATIFCTHEPCYRCLQRLVNAGISMVYFDKYYRHADPVRSDLLERTQISVKRYI